jgi:hypothetical protein
MRYEYECVCGSCDAFHGKLCKLYNERKEREHGETGIERHFREQEELASFYREVQASIDRVSATNRRNDR